MKAEALSPLCEPVLIAGGISHAFGRRGSQVPEKTLFPRQVHGIDVVLASEWEHSEAPPADALRASPGGARHIGIVTADCVPILLASSDGVHVAAIHAGWRGLAAGVIEAALQDFEQHAAPAGEVLAAIGPAARSCCYEVNEPVRAGLSERYTDLLDSETLQPGRAGHFQLDLPGLARKVLIEYGVQKTRIGMAQSLCTVCDADQFESYRRDGDASGRLRHFISRREPKSDEG